jgi:hypothetical protein
LRCPNDNLELHLNNYNDWVCPICGIIFYHEEEKDEKEYKNYIG